MIIAQQTLAMKVVTFGDHLPQDSTMNELIPAKDIERLIFEFRGVRVMMDSDLATLFGTETKKLKQQVKRNPDRFPEDFMFELTLDEGEASRSQFVTLNEVAASRHRDETAKRGQNIKYLPFAFTEHGVLMLANVLRSEQAIAMSIHIIRVFTRMREMLLAHHEVLKGTSKNPGSVI